MNRRECALRLGSIVALATFSGSLGLSRGAAPQSFGASLLSAPIELAGDWGRVLPRATDQVVERMRYTRLDGVLQVSDRQPMRFLW